MGLNERLVKLPDINYDQSEQDIDLETGVPWSRLDFLLTGEIKVTGANADGTLHDDMLQRLLEQVNLEWDGRYPIKNMAGRDLYQEFLANVVQEPSQDVLTTAEIQAAGTYAFSLRFSYYIAKRYMGRAFEFGVFPAVSTKNPLKLRCKWNKDAVNAGDDAGTGAIVKSGSDAYTWNTPPKLEVVQVEAPSAVGPNKIPQYLPFIETHRAKTFTTAETAMPWRIPDDRLIAMVLIRNTYGATEILEDAIDELSFEAAGEEWMNDIPLEILRGTEAEYFPAVSEETGYLRMLIADGGLLSNLLEPEYHDDLRYLFKLDAPTGSPGKLDITVVYAMPFGPPVTKESPRG